VPNTDGRVVKRLETAMAWINYELAMVFFANNLVNTFNKEFKVDIPAFTDSETGDIILGTTGLTSALLELTDAARTGHGIADGCDLRELGHTFRVLARDHPDTFPPGSTQELYCTESDATFSDVFNYTEPASAVFDDGNMCNLVCTVPGVPPSTYPIWCKDNGLAGARWTLSSLRGDLAHRLCPHATPTPTPNANSDDSGGITVISATK